MITEDRIRQIILQEIENLIDFDNDSRSQLERQLSNVDNGSMTSWADTYKKMSELTGKPEEHFRSQNAGAITNAMKSNGTIPTNHSTVGERGYNDWKANFIGRMSWQEYCNRFFLRY
jgi:hypothetical protein